MSEVFAIAALSGSGVDPTAAAAATTERATNTLAQHSAMPADFSALVSEGLAAMDAKVAHADAMVSRFAIDDSIPVHQVTIALEEARLSVEFAMQVRQRFVEGYRELMNMQL